MSTKADVLTVFRIKQERPDICVGDEDLQPPLKVTRREERPLGAGDYPRGREGREGREGDYPPRPRDPDHPRARDLDYHLARDQDYPRGRDSEYPRTPSDFPRGREDLHYSPRPRSGSSHPDSPPSGGQPGKGSPGGSNHYPPKVSGVPCPATPTRYTAPVHIDVGGSIYTSSLETLTRFPESRLAKMFNGAIPIILDSLKQHYFIDRDGKMFRHILNFLRSSRLILPASFSEVDLLLQEARYYDILGMVTAVEELKAERARRRGVAEGADVTEGPGDLDSGGDIDCVAVNISPDLGERISLSADRALLEGLFPEINAALMDSHNSGWNLDNKFVIRFPLNGYCKLNSLQVMSRLMSRGYRIAASNGGGVEGQQFSEYVFCKRREAGSAREEGR